MRSLLHRAAHLPTPALVLPVIAARSCYSFTVVRRVPEQLTLNGCIIAHTAESCCCSEVRGIAGIIFSPCAHS